MVRGDPRFARDDQIETIGRWIMIDFEKEKFCGDVKKLLGEISELIGPPTPTGDLRLTQDMATFNNYSNMITLNGSQNKLNVSANTTSNGNLTILNIGTGERIERSNFFGSNAHIELSLEKGTYSILATSTQISATYRIFLSYAQY